MDSIKAAIAKTLLAVGKKYQRGYCYPSQRCILRLLHKYHGIVISIRTLNRRLKEMERSGYFSRTRRIRAGKGGQLIFNSTLYEFGGKIYNWVFNQVSWGRNVFRFFRLPNLAKHKSKTARYTYPVDNLAGLISSVLHQRNDAPFVFRA